MGPHLRVLSESYLMNTNMTRLDGLQKKLHPCALNVASAFGGLRISGELEEYGLGKVVLTFRKIAVRKMQNLDHFSLRAKCSISNIVKITAAEFEPLLGVQ